jgi:hypothetical protein
MVSHGFYLWNLLTFGFVLCHFHHALMHQRIGALYANALKIMKSPTSYNLSSFVS